MPCGFASVVRRAEGGSVDIANLIIVQKSNEERHGLWLEEWNSRDRGLDTLPR
jgi:hypothetical protein